MNKHFVPELDDTDDFEFDEHDEANDELDDGILYVAAPRSIYNTIKFNHYLSKIFNDFPTYDIKVCKYEFSDSDHWKSIWLSLAPLIDKFIFVSDDNSFIGLGVYTEIKTLLPETDIFYLTSDYDYVPMNKLSLQIYNNGVCWVHFCRVITIADIVDK